MSLGDRCLVGLDLTILADIACLVRGPHTVHQWTGLLPDPATGGTYDVTITWTPS
jgi:hypothetical protein